MKIQATVLLSGLLLGAAVSAQTAAPAKAPEPDYTLSYNVGVVSDYRYRGISQTRRSPAVQGGVDFAHKSGFYLGTWASNIRWIRDNGVDGSVELDVYGGYKGSLSESVTYDLGVLRYEYLSNKLATTGTYGNANTQEVYLAVTAGPVTLKHSVSTGNLIGYLQSQHSGYTDLSATFDLGNGFSLTPHAGRQTVRRNANTSYSDYSLALVKDLGNGLSVSATAVTTNAEKAAWTSPQGVYLGNRTLVAGIKYAF